MSNPIEEYGLIGDGETAALVHRSGSIDWLCWPRFDSDACFAALLGTAENGCWKVAPTHLTRISRRYVEDTLVLETDFETAFGMARLTDFMTIRNGHSTLVRMARGLRGRVAMRSEMQLCFDYGSMRPWLDVQGGRAVARVGPDLAVLYSPIDLYCEGPVLLCEFELAESEERVFTLTYGSSSDPAPASINASAACSEVQDRWRRWIHRFEKPCQWPEAVRRSLIVLKAMIYQRTGGNDCGADHFAARAPRR